MEKNKKSYSLSLGATVCIIVIIILIVFCFIFSNLINKEGNNKVNSNNITIKNKKDEDELKVNNTTIRDNQNEEKVKANNIEIEFSSTGRTGGETLEYQGAPVMVKIDSLGATISYKTPDNSGIDIDTDTYEKYKELKKNIDIDKEKFSELVALINEKFYKLESDLSNNSVLDGDYARITIKNKADDTTYTIGGYAVRNEIFSEIESKIYETIGGYNVIKNFRNNELQQFIEDRKSAISKIPRGNMFFHIPSL